MLYSYVGTIDPWYKHDRKKLSKKTLLVIGTGNIGKRVVQYMGPFMRITTFDIIQNDITELEKLICKADCISLHVPKTDDNEAFIDKERLALMKDGAVLVNTARGAIVDETALFSELSSGRLLAAFDVFWHEPYNKGSF